MDIIGFLRIPIKPKIKFFIYGFLAGVIFVTIILMEIIVDYPEVLK